MSTNPPKYAITVNTSGVAVEAPTKKECLQLYKAVSNSQLKRAIDEAIR